MIMACDTIYGILGRAPDTLDEIRRIKGRGDAHPFLQLLARRRDISLLSPMKIPSDFLKLWPGPVSFILPDYHGGTVACRVPGDLFLRKIIIGAGQPVFSTSVNQTGENSEWKIDRIITHYESEVGGILDDGDLNGRQPSTLIDLSVTPFRIVRQGVFTLSDRMMEKYGIRIGSGG